MKQIKDNDTVKVNSPDMTGIWEVISIYDSRGIKTALVRGKWNGLLVETDYKSLRLEEDK